MFIFIPNLKTKNMKIENFNPGPIQITKSLYFFDGCKIELFEGEFFTFAGDVEISFIDNQIDLSNVNFILINDPEGKKCSLSDQLKRIAEKRIEDLLETLNVENC
jgi:hypothetical protein